MWAMYPNTDNWQEVRVGYHIWNDLVGGGGGSEIKILNSINPTGHTKSGRGVFENVTHGSATVTAAQKSTGLNYYLEIVLIW